jgi:hypothetical protein
MDAKHIAQLIAQVTDLLTTGKIDHEMQANLTASLWELAARKDLREEVTDILRQDALDEMGV